MENNLYERAFMEGYKKACIEVYEKLLKHGYSEEESRELSGVEEDDVKDVLK